MVEQFELNFNLKLKLLQINTVNFRENICSEDDLRSRIFGTFVVKFLACLPLLPIFNGF